MTSPDDGDEDQPHGPVHQRMGEASGLSGALSASALSRADRTDRDDGIQDGLAQRLGAHCPGTPHHHLGELPEGEQDQPATGRPQGDLAGCGGGEGLECPGLVRGLAAFGQRQLYADPCDEQVKESGRGVPEAGTVLDDRVVGHRPRDLADLLGAHGVDSLAAGERRRATQARTAQITPLIAPTVTSLTWCMPR